jgi:hypothetical protein
MSAGVGAALRAAREAQGLQQAEAAAALSHPVEALAALESERFDALSGRMRAFVSHPCKLSEVVVSNAVTRIVQAVKVAKPPGVVAIARLEP